jgi:hypothetical protein
MASLKNPVPSLPSDKEQVLDTLVATIKSEEDIRDMLFALIEVLNNYPPTLITDATGKQGNALFNQLGFVNVPTATSSLGALQPGGDHSTSSNPIVAITDGTFGPNTGGSNVPTISGTALVATTSSNLITLGTSDTDVYIQCDFTYSGGSVSIVDNEIMSTSGTVPSSTFTGSAGSGSGTIYMKLFSVFITAPVGSGPYTVVASPIVGGSQNFGVCLGATIDQLTGPWGI